MPFVKPVTVHAVVAVVQVDEPGEDVTVYAVIVDPPLTDGADHDTATEESPNTPDTPVGTPGTVAGTTAADAEEAEPAPALFVAETVKVYDVPFVRPVIVQLVVDVVQVNEPGDDVTVYAVTALPPLDDGADHDTTADESPNAPDTEVGTPGTVAGTTVDDAEEAEPVPALFVAATVNA